tara:strand:+ start:395 stop:1075 length:681 start_codon:yes stop_codon:yes gene_type:complete
MSSEKTEKKWQAQIINDNPVYPFILVDNWYTPDEEKAIWKELDFLTAIPKENIDRAENTIVARYPDGSSKSKAFRFYLEDYYHNRKISTVLSNMYKQKTRAFHHLVGECQPYAKSFHSANADTTLISYYEESDHYAPHHDTFLWTCLIWMVKDKSLFDGGDFKFNEPDIEVKLKNNRMVMFPCCFSHSASPVKFHSQPKEIGYGKYTITHFYYHVPWDLKTFHANK